MSFEKAVRTKLRFTTTRGQLSTEDICDMPLVSTNGFSLADLWASLDKETEKSAKVNPALKGKKIDTKLELRITVVNRIIELKQAEEKKAQKSAANKLEIEKLLGILSDRADGDREELSTKEIKKRIQKLS